MMIADFGPSRFTNITQSFTCLSAKLLKVTQHRSSVEGEECTGRTQIKCVFILVLIEFCAYDVR